MKLNEVFILRISILINLVEGLLEIFSSLILFVVNAPFIIKIMEFIFREELAEDSKDFLVQLMLNYANNLSIDTKFFLAIYFLVYGLINFSLAYVLLTKKVKHYFFVEIVLIILVIYQMYKFLYSHSLILLFFMLIDTFIIILVFRDHQKLLKGVKKKLSYLLN